MNVAELLHRAASRTPNATAIYSGEAPYVCYADLVGRAARLAGWLSCHGVCQNDRVVLYMENHPAYLEVLYAVFWVGAIAVPVNAKLHAKELAFILTDCSARLCFANSGTVGAAETAAGMCDANLSVYDVDRHRYRKMLDADAIECAVRSGDDIAWLFYTSGTTGVPKGAMLSHRNLVLMTMSYLCEVSSLDASDKLVHAAPISHGSGMYNFSRIMCGGAQIIPESRGFDVAEISDLSRRLSGMSMFLAPTMVHRILKETPSDDVFSGLKLMVYGGGPMLVEKTLAALERFGPRLAQIYGQGECPMTISRLTIQDHVQGADVGEFRRRLASAGRPFHLVDVRIGDASSPAQVGEPGEILVSSPIVMQGYWSRERGLGGAQQPEWLPTGDVGYLDDCGYLHLCDRSKDVIISGGANIYSREVEDVLVRHPNVGEVVVVGRPNEEWGEEVVAVLSSVGDRVPTIESLDALCRQDIAAFKRPRAYVFLSELPKNAYGKIEKRRIKEMPEVAASAGEQG